jgi:hypothetical protein
MYLQMDNSQTNNPQTDNEGDPLILIGVAYRVITKSGNK